MASRSDKSHELASRMAGWFFLVVGGVFIAAAFAIHTSVELVAWGLGILGVATLAFGALAPRERKVSAVETVLVLFVSLG